MAGDPVFRPAGEQQQYGGRHAGHRYDDGSRAWDNGQHHGLRDGRRRPQIEPRKAAAQRADCRRRRMSESSWGLSSRFASMPRRNSSLSRLIAPKFSKAPMKCPPICNAK